MAFLSLLWGPSLLSSYHAEKITRQSDGGDGVMAPARSVGTGKSKEAKRDDVVVSLSAQDA